MRRISGLFSGKNAREPQEAANECRLRQRSVVVQEKEAGTIFVSKRIKIRSFSHSLACALAFASSFAFASTFTFSFAHSLVCRAKDTIELYVVDRIQTDDA